MLHIVSFSTGLSSAICVERVYERYGPESMRVVFMDTGIEDDDNYRFKSELFARWHELSIETVTLKEGRSPYDVGHDERIIMNQKIAPCTYRLKIEPFVDYLESLDDDITVHIGYDYTETHRVKATKKNYNGRGWLVDFPLLWKPYEMRPYAEVCRVDWGIEPPRMYAMGYTHANCGGMCVKQGQGDWVRTLINFPERFAYAEKWERKMRALSEKHGGYAMLRDRTGGELKPKTLTELRNEYEDTGNQLSLFDADSIACIYCGVGDYVGVDSC